MNVRNSQEDVVTCLKIRQDKAALVQQDDKDKLRQATTGNSTEIHKVYRPALPIMSSVFLSRIVSVTAAAAISATDPNYSHSLPSKHGCDM